MTVLELKQILADLPDDMEVTTYDYETCYDDTACPAVCRKEKKYFEEIQPEELVLRFNHILGI